MINNEHEAFVPLTGQCLCGALRFQLTAEPQAARVCWCRDCQHLAGNGMANAVVPVEALHFQGRLAQFQKTAASGNTITREFVLNVVRTYLPTRPRAHICAWCA